MLTLLRHAADTLGYELKEYPIVISRGQISKVLAMTLVAQGTSKDITYMRDHNKPGHWAAEFKDRTLAIIHKTDWYPDFPAILARVELQGLVGSVKACGGVTMNRLLENGETSEPRN